MKGKIGFVPTMGALHKGHLKLIETSVNENDVTVCSIFINPLQFNNSNDFEKYPIKTEEDIELVQKSGCNVLFMPLASEMYNEKPIVSFSFGHLDSVMEGKYRPGHFNGVALIVAKLFNIVKPVNAYFGQKDYQQLAVIKQLVEDLSFSINIKSVETVREENGLALSSRNLLLNDEEKNIATILYSYLIKAKERALKGTLPLQIKYEAYEFFKEKEGITLDYFEIADPKTLLPINEYNNGAIICIAAFVGGIRLIDNILI